MSEKNPNSLDRLFDQFDAKRQAEKTAAAQNAETERAVRQQALTALRNFVVPAFERIAQDVGRRGYEAKLQERFDNFVYPGVTFSFRLVPQEQNAPYTQASTLSVALSSNGGLEVTCHIHGPKLHMAGGAPSGSFPINKIDAAWAETQAVAFIRTVLNAN